MFSFSFSFKLCQIRSSESNQIFEVVVLWPNILTPIFSRKQQFLHIIWLTCATIKRRLFDQKSLTRNIAFFFKSAKSSWKLQVHINILSEENKGKASFGIKKNIFYQDMKSGTRAISCCQNTWWHFVGINISLWNFSYD